MELNMLVIQSPSFNCQIDKFKSRKGYKFNSFKQPYNPNKGWNGKNHGQFRSWSRWSRRREKLKKTKKGDKKQEEDKNKKETKVQKGGSK